MSRPDIKRSEMTFDDLVVAFNAGVNDYTGGEVPDGWDAEDSNNDPYLAGWNIAADAENGQKYFAGDDDDEEGEDED